MGPFRVCKYPEKDRDKKYNACIICRIQLKYSGHTSNLADYFKRKHSDQATPERLHVKAECDNKQPTLADQR